MVYLDTHLVIWLFAGLLDYLPSRVVQLLEETDLYISPIVLLELQYLKDAKKIKKSPAAILEALQKEINLKVCDKSFHAVIQESLNLHWTRDPFDRITVAHASLNANKLLTKDKDIHKHYKQAVW